MILQLGIAAARQPHVPTILSQNFEMHMQGEYTKRVLVSTCMLGCRWGQGGRQTLPLLQTLDLSGNSLTGTLPSSWGQNSAMSSLKMLDLQKNNFSGSIPASWGDSAANQPRFSQLTALAVQPGREPTVTALTCHDLGFDPGQCVTSSWHLPVFISCSKHWLFGGDQ